MSDLIAERTAERKAKGVGVRVLERAQEIGAYTAEKLLYSGHSRR